MLAAAGLVGPSRAMGAAAQSLDPVNPDLRFGITGAIWGEWSKGKPMKASTDMQQMIAETARFGFQGFEPFSTQLGEFVNKPLAIKKLCDAAGVTFINVGDLPLAATTPLPASPAAAASASPFGGGPFPWLGEQGNKQLIADMVKFARDFLAPLGCDHWKNNMGGRPEKGPSDDQLKRLADTLNEIGRQTIAYGIRLAPHPHIWGPMEREHEFRRVMELTDPRYVWLTLDTGHNVLGGMDALAITKEYLPRIAEFHLKDTYARYRGNKVTLAPSAYIDSSIWGNLGEFGGVDFPGIFKVVRDRHWKGWMVVDVDAPRPGEGTATIDDAVAANVNYLRKVLHVKLPTPPKHA
jgi:sugar phosphate isomerase/epimerase